ncbi:MAG: hypothetical protein GX879_05480 [Bacteroidales bacterium]|nr:hypothetical protein [Bacteroidales bacterium]
MKTIKIFSFFFLLMQLSGCSYIFELKKDGEIIKIELGKLEDSIIEIYAPCNIILHNNTNENIKIEGVDFIVENYFLSKNDSATIIDHKNILHLNKNRVADIYIPVNNLEFIVLNSSATVTSKDTLFFNELQLVVNGKGIYSTSDLIINSHKFHLNVYGDSNQSSHTFSGYAEFTRFNIHGITIVDGSKLETRRTLIAHKSVGNIHIKATEAINGSIYSIGNLFYTGNPEVNINNVKSYGMQATGKVINNN